jgi:hypothetical protein
MQVNLTINTSEIDQQCWSHISQDVKSLVDYFNVKCGHIKVTAVPPLQFPNTDTLALIYLLNQCLAALYSSNLSTTTAGDILCIYAVVCGMLGLKINLGGLCHFANYNPNSHKLSDGIIGLCNLKQINPQKYPGILEIKSDIDNLKNVINMKFETTNQYNWNKN